MASCSLSSHNSGEQLFATAARADTWFLLEHAQTYGREALAESGLIDVVRRHLEKAAESVGNGRIQLIKRNGVEPENGVAFFVSVNHEEQPNLYEFHLDKVEDLLDLDLEAVANEDAAYHGHDRTRPLFLVCTNGKRDPCCSRLGMLLYREMRRHFKEDVWQTSHVGGHRFAPNVVVLPSGANYGYVGPGDLALIVKAANAGKLHLPNYRGRSCYAKHVQAADTFLRRHTAQADLLQFKLIESEALEENLWMLHFTDRFSNRSYCVRIRSIPAAVMVQKSCSETGEVPISQFVVEEIREF